MECTNSECCNAVAGSDSALSRREQACSCASLALLTQGVHVGIRGRAPVVGAGASLPAAMASKASVPTHAYSSMRGNELGDCMRKLIRTSTV
jgi:hypothetical protein